MNLHTDHSNVRELRKRKSADEINILAKSIMRRALEDPDWKNQTFQKFIDLMHQADKNAYGVVYSDLRRFITKQVMMNPNWIAYLLGLKSIRSPEMVSADAIVNQPYIPHNPY